MTVRQINNEMIAAAVAALRATTRPLATAEAKLAKATAARATAAKAAETARATAAAEAKAAAKAAKRVITLKRAAAKAAAVEAAETARATAEAAAAEAAAAEAKLAKATAAAEVAANNVRVTESKTRDARLAAESDCFKLAKASTKAAARFIDAIITLNSLTRSEQELIIATAENILHRHVAFSADCTMSYYYNGSGPCYNGYCSDTAYCDAVTTSAKKVVLKEVGFAYYDNSTCSNRIHNMGRQIAASNAHNATKLLSSMHNISNMHLV